MTEKTSLMKIGRPKGGAIAYPWGLSEKDVEAIFEACPFEVDLKQNSKNGLSGNFPLVSTFLDPFVKSRTAMKIGLRQFQIDNPSVGNKVAYHKFRYLCIVLLKHPGLINGRMRSLIEGSAFLSSFLKNMKYRTLTLPNSGQEVSVLEEVRPLSPMATQQETKIKIISDMMDKIQLVLSHISTNKVKKAGLGVLSKSLSDLTKAYVVMKDGVTMQTFNQYNINKMTLVQKKELSQKIGSKE